MVFRYNGNLEYAQYNKQQQQQQRFHNFFYANNSITF